MNCVIKNRVYTIRTGRKRDFLETFKIVQKNRVYTIRTGRKRDFLETFKIVQNGRFLTCQTQPGVLLKNLILIDFIFVD